MNKLLFIIFLFFCSYAFAQNGGVKGVVKDEITNETIIGAAISVNDKNGTVTDIDGNYFLKLNEGEYTLKITYVGYKSKEQKISIGKSTITIDFTLSTFQLKEVEVVSDIAIARKTPVAFSNISPQKIQEQLGTQDLPMILNSTPGVYATQQGGGDGDARISIRGFNSQYVMVLIDGIPMNDIYNGRVFWSNWFGLDNQTKSVQVQRGLGASKLATPSVGGTMNILTSGTEVNRKVVLKQEVGNNSNARTTISMNSGKLKWDWSISSAFSYRRNDGWVDQLTSKMFFYYFKIDKRIGKHNLSASAFAGPQVSGQRSFLIDQQVWRYSLDEAVKLGVDTAGQRYKSYGRRYNPGWGYLRRTRDATGGANLEVINTNINQFHKPVISIKDFWTINNKFYLSNIIYSSNGRGFGTQLQNTISSITPGSSGELDIQSIYNGNTSLTGSQPIPGKFESKNFIRSNHNDHQWYGALSTFNYSPNAHFDFSGGLDARTYTGIVYSKIHDLLGGDYMRSKVNLNEANNTLKLVGDTMNQNLRRYINWGGVFGLAEYKGGWFTAFLNVSGSRTGYKQLNYFAKKTLQVANFNNTKDTTLNIGYEDTLVYNGVTYDRTAQGLKFKQTDWHYYNGFTVKGGMNFNITERQNIFVNIGHFRRPPLMTFVFTAANTLFKGVKNESITSFEIGYNFKSPKFSANFNSYYTIWDNKPTTVSPIINGEAYPTAAIGMGALHKGVEIDFAIIIIKQVTLEGMASIGDWRWNKVANAQVTSENGDSIGYFKFDPRGIRVGDAAQQTYAASIRYEAFKGFYIKPQFNYFSQNYALFSPQALEITDIKKNYGPNIGRQAWRLPNYGLVDINLGYGFKHNKVKYDIRASVQNIFDTFFISDAEDNQFGSTFNANAADVSVGLGRRWVASLSATF